MAYEQMGRQILEDSVATVREGGDTTVNGFTEKVQAEVRRKADTLREQFGDAAKDLVGDAMAQAETYAQTKKRIFDPSFQVKDAASKGAAAYAEMGSKRITVDDGAMDVETNEGYWERIRRHEEVHVRDQVAGYNRSEITYVTSSGAERTVDVIGSMTEGQATQVNEDADLTAEYKGFKRDWTEMAVVVGEGAMNDAMRSGDMQALQERIMEDAAPEVANAA